MSDRKKRSHFIQRLKFDLVIDQQEDAYRIQNDMFRLVNQKLERLIDKILDEYDDPMFVTKLAKIEVNLGDITESTLTTEVLMKFEKAFRSALAMQMAEIKHPVAVVSKDRGERLALAPAKLDIIAYFLINGRMPIGAEREAGKVEKMIWDLLGEEPGNLVKALKSTVRNSAAALRRLSTGFSDKLIDRLYRQSSGMNSITLASYEKRIVDGLAKATGRAKAPLQADVRETMLRYLFIDMPPIFILAKMEEAVAKTVTTKYGKDAEPIFTGQKAKGDQRRQDLSAIDTGKRLEAALDIVHARLRQAADKGDDAAFLDAWHYLVTHDVQALKRVLAQHADTPGRMQRVVATLPVQSLRDFVQRASPTLGLRLVQLVATVISAHDLYAPASRNQQQVVEAVHKALLEAVVQDSGGAPSLQEALARIEETIKSTKGVQKKFVEEWKRFDFLDEFTAPTKPVKERKATPTAEEQAAEQKRVQAEMEALAEEERKLPPLTPAERKAREQAYQRKVEEERARKQAAESGASDDEGEKTGFSDVDDAEFYRRGRALEGSHIYEAAGIEAFERLDGVKEGVDAFESPILLTVDAQAEAVMHFLATGTAPWWAARMIPLQVELFAKQLLAREPEAMRRAFVNVAKGLPASRYPKFIQRASVMLEEKTFSQFVLAVAGDLAGFVVSVGMMLEAAIKALPEGVAVPTKPKEIQRFAYQHQIAYLLAYRSASPSPGQMVRFVLKELQPTVGLASRKLIEWIGEVVETLVASGQPRFNALKNMLPRTFEGLDVTAPPAPTTEERLLQMAFEQALVEHVPPESPTGPMSRRKGKAGTTDSPETAQEGSQETNQGTPTEEKGIPGQEAPTTKRPTEEGKEEGEISTEKPEGEGTEGEGTEGERPEGKKTTQQKRSLRERMEAVYGPKAGAPAEPVKPKQLVLTPEQAAEMGIDGTWAIAAVRHYLIHGSLTPETTAMFTPASFREEVRQVLADSSREVVQMVREVVQFSGARARIFQMGDEVLLRVVELLNLPSAKAFAPYLQVIMQLFRGGSAPISKAVVFEHAVRHAMGLRTSFVPSTYIRDLFEFVAVQPNVKVADVMVWANRRLESMNDPLAPKIVDMIDVVDRIEQLRKERQAQPSSKPYVPPRVQPRLDDEIYVSNAGVCIIYLHLIMLFKACGLLTEDRTAFVDRQAQMRAIHMVQYLCYHEWDTPEEKMVLAKLIVGWPLIEPIEPLERPWEADDVESCDSIMTAVTTQWTIMKNAGSEYVRKTFIERDGRLKKTGDNWTLRVQDQGLDILKNKIPWSTNPIRMPWNNYLIEVEWP